MRIRIALGLCAVVAIVAGCTAAPAAQPTPSSTGSPSPTPTPAPVTVGTTEVVAAEPDAMLGGDNRGAADTAVAEDAASAAAEAVAEAVVTHRDGGDPVADLRVDESLPVDELRALFDSLPGDAVEVSATGAATEHGPVVAVTAGVLEFLFTSDDDGPVLISAALEG